MNLPEVEFLVIKLIRDTFLEAGKIRRWVCWYSLF